MSNKDLFLLIFLCIPWCLVHKLIHSSGELSVHRLSVGPHPGMVTAAEECVALPFGTVILLFFGFLKAMIRHQGVVPRHTLY